MKQMVCGLLVAALVSIPMYAGAIVTVQYISLSGNEINEEYRQVTVRVDLEDDTHTVMVVRDSNDEIVLFQDYESPYISFVWDGVDQDGNMLPNGQYTIQLSNSSLQSLHSYSVSIDRAFSPVVLRGEEHIYIAFGETWIDPGVESQEAVSITGEVDTKQLGTSTITYHVADTVLERTVVVTPIPVAIELSDLVHVYDGTPKMVGVHVDTPVAYTSMYAGTNTPPTEVGLYDVLVQIDEYGYYGTATSTLEIRASQNLETQTGPIATTGTRTESTKKSAVVPAVNEETAHTFFDLDIEALQRTLIATGHLAIEAPTGIFGPLTHAALRFYQLAHGIPATGFVDESTMQSLQTTAAQNPEELRMRLQQILRTVEQMVAQSN